jgi:hypothetical protein
MTTHAASKFKFPSHSVSPQRRAREFAFGILIQELLNVPGSERGKEMLKVRGEVSRICCFVRSRAGYLRKM